MRCRPCGVITTGKGRANLPALPMRRAAETVTDKNGKSNREYNHGNLITMFRKNVHELHVFFRVRFSFFGSISAARVK